MSRNRILGVLFFGVLMAALDIAIIGPALPTIQQAFGVDERSIAWVFSIYVLMNLVSTPLMAKLSDIYGRRAVYVTDVALFGIGSAVVMLSPSFAILLLGRAIQGFGAGGIFPVASAVIGDTFPPEKRGGALGLIGAVFGLAFIIGPIIGGLLLLSNWQLIFAINLPIAVILILAAWRVLPTTRPAQRKPFDWLGMATLALLLTSLAYGLNQIDTQNFGASLASLQVWPFLLMALLLIPLFWVLEQRAADPIVRPALLAPRQLRLASALSFGAGLGEVSVMFMPALAVSAFAVTSSSASFMLMPLVLALFIGSPVAGRILDRLGSRSVIIGGTSLLALGTIGMGLWGDSQVGYYGGSILVGFGLASLLGAPIRYIMLNEAAAGERAAAQSVATVFTSIGQLVGAAAVGAIVASIGGSAGYSAAFLTIGAISIVLAVLAFALKDRAAEQAMVAANALADTPTHRLLETAPADGAGDTLGMAVESGT
jgi:EmrB/QacA subfamily drug resistance transporter